MKKIVAITLDASRTGAPILLHRLLVLLKPLYTINTVIKRDGPLREDFEKIGNILLYPKPYWAYTASKSFILKAISYFIQPLRTLYFHFQLHIIVKNADLIFANTITNGKILKRIKLKKTVISYVHELEFISSFYNSFKDVKYQIDISSLILVPCETVKEYLINTYLVKKEKIKTLNYFFELNHIEIPIKELSEKSDAFIVLGSGTADWRKGFDLFYQTAHSLVQIRKNKDFHFIWVGGNHKETFAVQANFDIMKLGLSEIITLIPEVTNPLKYIQQANIFFLPSREDPYPVVVLEAAAFGIPCICFDKGGGIVEFVEKDAGWIVPYLGVKEAALKINNLIENPGEVVKYGQVAKKKLAIRHSKEIVVSQLNDILKAV